MAAKNLMCPVCEEGVLTEATFAGDFKHGAQMLHVEGLECYHCTSCGEEPVLPDQIRKNHLTIADAKRRRVGLLTGAEVRVAREQLGLTQTEAADLLGGGVNAFSKYECGAVLQSRAMDKLIRIYLRRPNLLLESPGLDESTEIKWTTETTPTQASSPRIVTPNMIPKHSTVLEPPTWKRIAA